MRDVMRQCGASKTLLGCYAGFSVYNIMRPAVTVRGSFAPTGCAPLGGLILAQCQVCFFSANLKLIPLCYIAWHNWFVTDLACNISNDTVSNFEPRDLPSTQQQNSTLHWSLPKELIGACDTLDRSRKMLKSQRVDNAQLGAPATHKLPFPA